MSVSYYDDPDTFQGALLKISRYYESGLFFFHSPCSIDFIYVACKFYPFMICCR